MKLIRIHNNKEDAKEFQDAAIRTLLDTVDDLKEGLKTLDLTLLGDEINNEFLPAIKIRDWSRANACLSEMFKTVDLLNINALDMFYESISLHLMDIIEYEDYI